MYQQILEKSAFIFSEIGITGCFGLLILMIVFIAFTTNKNLPIKQGYSTPDIPLVKKVINPILFTLIIVLVLFISLPEPYFDLGDTRVSYSKGHNRIVITYQTESETDTKDIEGHTLIEKVYEYKKIACIKNGRELAPETCWNTVKGMSKEQIMAMSTDLITIEKTVLNK